MVSGPDPTPDNTGDRVVLVSLYNSMRGRSRSDNTSWLSGQLMGQWAVVTTEGSMRGNRPTRPHLPGQEL